MSDNVIRVENLGKRYRIGVAAKRPQSAWEAAKGLLGAPFEYLRRMSRPSTEEETLWALRDVSFEVQRGEVVGIIGRNGAGKTTLLKLLSRITEPTDGRAIIDGRVGSLLEVGTGFHPELTGRENITLNGAILGMKRAEIERKFDEIVDFAEIEKFIDTPVKHYSSGMYVRLAFAVAAHLEPEILLVDEVLAVGDAGFQKKCLGKMGDVAREGRTVLFVSHNMSAMISLCQKGLLLASGSLVMNSGIAETVSRYMSDTKLMGMYCKRERDAQGKLSIDRACLLLDGSVATSFCNSDTLVLRIECSVREKLVGAQIAFELLTDLDECLFSSTSQDSTRSKGKLDPGVYIFQCQIDLGMFRQGRYRIKLSSSIPAIEMLDVVEEMLAFEVFDDSSPILKLGQNRRGFILPILPWAVGKS